MKKSVSNNGKISIYWGISFSLLFNVLSLPCFGQDSTKKKVTEKEYYKWGKLYTVALADGTDWTSFRMVYENTDTLFVKNSRTGKDFRLPNGTNGRFLGRYHYIYRTSQNGYEIISLSGSERISLNDAKWVEASQDQKYLVTATALNGTDAIVTVRNLKGLILRTITNVIEYTMNPDNNALLYTAKTEEGYIVKLLDLNKLSSKQIAYDSYPYASLTWQKNGESLAFAQCKTGDTDDAPLLYLYNVKNDYLKELDLKNNPELKNSRFSSRDRLHISFDGQTVFFSIENGIKKDSKTHGDSPEIWYSNTPQLYPAAKWMNEANHNIIRYAWNVESESAHTINTEDLNDVSPTGREKYLISKDIKKYPDNYRFYPDIDYYISPAKQNNPVIFLENQSSDPSMLSTSPVSDLIAYYKEKNWYLYDPKTRLHRNLTSATMTKWDNEGDNRIPPTIPYGVAAWSADGGSILLYDRFDIWLFDLHKAQGQRITKGREKNIVFRLQHTTIDKTINLENEILLVANSSMDATRSYYLWREGKETLNICADNTWNDQITVGQRGNIIWREQSSGASPCLVFFRAKSRKKQKIYYSNAQQKQYEWGKSEMVHYRDQKGNNLNAALFYPAGYIKGKKYPMIVFIYEFMSQRLHQYEIPTIYNEDGFNVTNYTLDGYFVLLPDIYYEIGSPGKSAADCIINAVTASLKKDGIDKKKIGLIGHSFGGYETNIVIAQTNTFAAAVSGAGASNTTGLYFNIGEEIGAPEAWRFENQQMRMGKTFFENRQGYIDNSPVMNATAIRTPLLIWSGKNDSTVPVDQSIAMHIALRRLEKPNILLCYPNENHVLSSLSAQADLTRRVRDWFGYFLKNDTADEWIAKGLQ